MAIMTLADCTIETVRVECRRSVLVPDGWHVTVAPAADTREPVTVLVKTNRWPWVALVLGRLDRDDADAAHDLAVEWLYDYLEAREPREPEYWTEGI